MSDYINFTLNDYSEMNSINFQDEPTYSLFQQLQYQSSVPHHISFPYQQETSATKVYKLRKLVKFLIIIAQCKSGLNIQECFNIPISSYYEQYINVVDFLKNLEDQDSIGYNDIISYARRLVLLLNDLYQTELVNVTQVSNLFEILYQQIEELSSNEYSANIHIQLSKQQRDEYISQFRQSLQIRSLEKFRELSSYEYLSDLDQLQEEKQSIHENFHIVWNLSIYLGLKIKKSYRCYNQDEILLNKYGINQKRISKPYANLVRLLMFVPTNQAIHVFQNVREVCKRLGYQRKINDKEMAKRVQAIQKKKKNKGNVALEWFIEFLRLYRGYIKEQIAAHSLLQYIIRIKDEFDEEEDEDIFFPESKWSYNKLFI